MTEFARPTDAAEIARLFSSSFRLEVAQLLIYGCRGAPEHIRMQVASCLPNQESVYFVARASEGIIGAVELRRQTKGLFLNYIAVDPGHRAQGVATTLLSNAIKMAGAGSGQIALDVLQDNSRALEWYSRVGFALGTTAEFVELAPPGGASEVPAYVSGLPQADVCQERFGFSKFSLISPKGTFSVGRIGHRWFRLTDLAAVDNTAIFNALKLLDPGRRIFAVVPASSAPVAQVVRVLAKTCRMEADIPSLMSSLSHDRKKSRKLV